MSFILKNGFNFVVKNEFNLISFKINFCPIFKIFWSRQMKNETNIELFKK